MFSGTGADFYQVALHEIGHALGLADNSDPNSVLYYAASATNQQLDVTDVAAIQALYGPSSASAVLGSEGSGSLTSSSQLLNQLIQAMSAFSPQQKLVALGSPPATLNESHGIIAPSIRMSAF